MVRGEANSPILIISLFYGPLVSVMHVDHCAIPPCCFRNLFWQCTICLVAPASGKCLGKYLSIMEYIK